MPVPRRQIPILIVAPFLSSSPRYRRQTKSATKSRDSTPIASSSQLVEQCLRLFEIGSVEAFCEPVIHGREKVAGVGGVALVAAKPGEAHGGAQFPELGLLLPRDAQGFAIQLFSDVGAALA